MSLRSPSNPRELRAALHAVYEPYAQGIVDFPRARVKPEAIDGLPERTQPIAQAILDAWARIDFDKEVHKALIENALKSFSKDPENALRLDDGTPAKAMIVGDIGRNVLVETVFIPVHEEKKILIVETQIGPRAEREAYLESARVELADGRVITGGGFDGAQVPDVEVPLLTPDGFMGRFVHFDATSRAA